MQQDQSFGPLSFIGISIPSPQYSSYWSDNKDTIITFDLDDIVLERIEKETRNWGILQWRNPSFGERFWGHVYMSVDTKIEQIIMETYGERGLIEKVKEIRGCTANNLNNLVLDRNIFLLPTHFSVISSMEWQKAFFGLGKNVEYFTVDNPVDDLFQSSVEMVNTPYTTYSKVMKEEKIRDLCNFIYFTQSEFANSIPKETVSHIKDYLILDLQQEIGRRVKFSLSGQVSLVPRYYGDKIGFILHLECPEMNLLRKEYGFKSMQFFIPLGVENYGRVLPTEPTTTPIPARRVFIKNFSKKRTHNMMMQLNKQ